MQDRHAIAHIRGSVKCLFQIAYDKAAIAAALRCVANEIDQGKIKPPKTIGRRAQANTHD